MSRLDKIIKGLSPAWALKREQSRRILSYYEAVRPTTSRKALRETGGPDGAIARDILSLKQQARHLEQNLDLARGVLDILVQNTVGPQGIQVEPQPRRADGSIHEEFARQILMLHRDWSRRPEVTWQHSWPSAQRIMARSLYRDGEVLAQRILGSLATLNHGTTTPYSLELLESDFLADHDDLSLNIRMGVQRNQWNRPVGYWFHKKHPADANYYLTMQELKRLPAERVLHLKMVDRIGQVRGVSIFASVLTRLEDIKDYEESERIAAKVAASMAAFIIKGQPELYDQESALDKDPRQIKFRPGMVFDDLEPGESIGTVDTNRPNTSLAAHRSGQLRAVASGCRVTYSSAAKDYNGTYSAQRQELVEGYGAYGVLAEELIGQFVRPVYEDFLEAAVLGRQLAIPADVDKDSLSDALFVPPQMPWIDPDKESKALERLEGNAHASGPEIIRRRGQNPRDVLEQEANWRRLLKQHDISTTFNEGSLESDDDDSEEKPTTRVV